MMTKDKKKLFAEFLVVVGAKFILGLHSILNRKGMKFSGNQDEMKKIIVGLFIL